MLVSRHETRYANHRAVSTAPSGNREATPTPPLCRLGLVFQCNPGHLDGHAQSKHQQPRPYFGRQGHQYATQHHQSCCQYASCSPLSQHAEVPPFLTGLLVAQNFFGGHVGAESLDQRLDLRQQHTVLVVFQCATAYQPGTQPFQEGIPD